MKLNTLLIVLFLTFSSISLYAQAKTEINKSEITGDWKLINVKDEKGTVLETEWPFTDLKFNKEGHFVMITPSATAEGKYEINTNLLRLYDATTQGVKQDKEETLIISKLNSKSLIILMDMGNKKWYIEYVKK